MNGRVRWLVAAAAVMLFIGHTSRSVWTASWNHGLDGGVYYLGGRAWLEGESPYDRETYARHYERWAGSDVGVSRSVFVSPPTIAPIALLVALFEWPVALRIVDALELAAWLAIAYVCLAWTREGGRLVTPYGLTCVAVAGCFGAPSATMLFGQMGLYALAGALGTIHALRRGSPFLAVPMILLATIKPQVSALLLVYALLLGPVRPFLVAATLAAGLLVAVESSAGLATLPERFGESLAAYAAHPFNAELGNRVGLGGLFAHTPFDRAAFATAAVLGALGTVWLGLRARRRRRAGAATGARTIEALESLDVFVILLASALAMPIFSYDFLAPSACLVLSALFPTARERAVLFGLFLATAKLHGIEERLVHPTTPILHVLDGRVMQMLAAIACASAAALTIARQRALSRPRSSVDLAGDAVPGGAPRRALEYVPASSASRQGQ